MLSLSLGHVCICILSAVVVQSVTLMGPKTNPARKGGGGGRGGQGRLTGLNGPVECAAA